MNKKLLSLLAVSTLSLGVLTACGSGEKKSEETKTEQSAPFLKVFLRRGLGLLQLVKT